MIKTLLKRSWIFIIILGAITTAVWVMTGSFNFDNMSIINHEIIYINGWQWNYYTIDIKLYLTNLEGSLDASIMEGIMPNIPQLPTWPQLDWSIQNWWLNIAELLKAISKYMIYALNWMIYITNIVVLTMPKIFIYPIRMILALLGLNVTDYSFYEFVDMIYNIKIPYIPINY